MRNWLFLIVLAVLIAGCAGSNQHLKTLPANATSPASGSETTFAELFAPPLPAASGTLLSTEDRTASMELVTVIPGAEFHQKSDEAQISETSLYLPASAGQLSWGVYGIAGLAADYRPLDVELQVLETGRVYYVALADYDSDSWEILPEQFTDGRVAAGHDGGSTRIPHRGPGC